MIRIFFQECNKEPCNCAGIKGALGAIGPAGVPGQEGAPGDTGYDGRNFQNDKFTNSLLRIF